MELLRRALERTERGDALALVTVVEVSGSAPRQVGARMLVDERGDIEKTVGGGRVELEVTRAAAEVAAGAPARLVVHHLTRDLAMCCGGSMTFYIEPVAPIAGVIAEALTRVSERRPGVLMTPLGPSSGESASQPAGGQGGKQIRDMPDPALTEPECKDGTLFEPVLPDPRVLLFGCGHVSRALGPMADAIGFAVVMCDDGETEALSSIADAPWVAGTVDSFDIRDIERALGPLGIGDYALIMTRDHAIDQKILERLIGNRALTYLGMIGSRGKVGRFFKRLRAKGLITGDTDELWTRLHAPIGLDIGAETPAEIAVAVVAQLVALRRQRSAR